MTTPKYTPRSILMDRERKKLEALAHDSGFESSASMIYDMYVVQGLPITEISRRLFTPMWSLRKRFDELGIPVRSRGGRNNVRMELTQELVNEASRDGIIAVADRIGVDPYTVYLQLRRWWEERQKNDNPEL